MRFFNPDDLIVVDLEAEKDFKKQAVYEYGDKFELSVITDNDIEYGYCLFFCGHEGYIDTWPTDSLSAEDVDSLMGFLINLTGYKPKQI